MPASAPEDLPIEWEEAASKGRYVVRLDGVQAEMIVPLCPFAKAQISHHPEWQDVLAR
jgi:predicted GNAT family acetyltransferase